MMRTFQAVLGRAENVARTQKMRGAIEQIGGRLEIASPTPNGMVRVTLWLPPQYQPGDFFPDLPFYPC